MSNPMEYQTSSSSTSPEHDLSDVRPIDNKSKFIGVNEFAKESGNIKIPSELLSFDSNQVSLWLTHYPIQRNHPRRPSLDETADVSYIQSDEAICMKSNDTLFDCLNCLIRHGISTVPVLDQKSKVMAVIDLLDIIFFILRSFSGYRERESLTDLNALQIYWNKFLETWRLGSGIKNITIDEAINNPIWAYKHKCVTIKPFYSTFSVLEMLVRERLHAIPIVHSNGTPRNIFTRSMMISLIDQNIDLFGDLMMKQVSVLISLLQLPTVISINENSPVLDAFKIMVQLNCSGLPVVNNENNLVNCISRRDIRGLITEEMDFKRLWMSVGELKHLVEEEFPSQTPHSVIYVTKHDTLKKLITLMNDGNIHRVFVVEEDEKRSLSLKSIITQYDLLKFLLIQLGLQF